MAEPSRSKTFELPLQLAVEQLITDVLIARLKAALPASARVRVLRGAEQVHGDLEVTLGDYVTYIELKAEDYSRSLFAEPIQFWVKKDGSATYRRSWAYTTTAQWMLYLSVRTGSMLLCPRHPWLSTGLKLLDAYLLQSLARAKGQEAYRPYVTLNTQLGSDEMRHFSGGAAGSGIDTWTWLEGFAAAGHDASQVLLADGREMLAAARAQVRGWNDEWLMKYISERVDPRQLAKPGVFANVIAEVRRRAGEAAPDESSEAARIRKTLLAVGGRTTPGLELVGQQLAQKLPAWAREPLVDPMWFQATACLQCGWTKKPDDVSRAVIGEALASTFKLNKAGLPKGAEIPEKMREMRMRLSATDVAAHGSRPSWVEAKGWFALPAEEALSAQRDYVRLFRHAA